MTRRIISGLACISVLAGIASAAEVQSVNVVGFQKLTILGGGSAVYNLLSAPMTKIPVDKGVITANTATTITDSGAGWTIGEFNAGVSRETHGTSTFYIEITKTNSAFEGRHFYIASNNGTVLTLTAAMTDVNAGDLVGASYKIIAANRVRDIFGEPGSQVLTGGGDFTTADNILFWTGTGWGDPVFYQTSGYPTSLRTHWVQGSSIVDDLAVDRDCGFFVKRLAGGGSTNLTITGEVSANAQRNVLDPKSIGYCLIGGMSAVTVAIGNSGLTNVLQGGGDFTTADNVYAWTGSGWGDPVFYQTSGYPTSLRTHWVQNGSIVDSAFMLEAGKGYLFKIIGSPEIWKRASPLE